MTRSIDDLARLWAEDFWDKRNYDIADEILSDDFVRRGPSGVFTGREHYKEFLREQHAAFPDYHHTVIDRAIDRAAGKALLLYHVTGTFRAPYGGHAPTGKRLDCNAMDLLTVGDGRIVSCHGMFDRLGMYEQLGIL